MRKRERERIFLCNTSGKPGSRRVFVTGKIQINCTQIQKKKKKKKKKKRDLYHLKTCLRFPCLGLNPIIDFFNPCIAKTKVLISCTAGNCTADLHLCFPIMKTCPCNIQRIFAAKKKSENLLEIFVFKTLIVEANFKKYPQSMFWKKNVFSCKPQFYYFKVGDMDIFYTDIFA